MIENAAARGARLLAAFADMARRHELVKEVRGKGLMIGLEFGAPRSLALKASWNLLETMNKGLFCQLITIPLFKEHKILCQVAGHGSLTVKLLPPLIISDRRLRLDRARVRRGDRGGSSRAGRGVVARQDARRARHEGAREDGAQRPIRPAWVSLRSTHTKRCSRIVFAPTLRSVRLHREACAQSTSALRPF